jgi:hypothetical protein
MEQAMLSAQAANTKRIRELEKQVASITTELQKVCQQLTTAPHNKPNGKSADKATPAAPPATPRVTTPAAPHLQKPLDIWGNPTENPSWADRLHAGISQQQEKSYTTIMHRNKKPAPITIIPKALPRIETEVIITWGIHIPDTDTRYRAKLADHPLRRFTCAIRQSADITLPPFILIRVNSNNTLVLMTNPTTPATAYASYLLMLSAKIKSL